jgi:hypothetical protein
MTPTTGTCRANSPSRLREALAGWHYWHGGPGLGAVRPGARESPAIHVGNTTALPRVVSCDGANATPHGKNYASSDARHSAWQEMYTANWLRRVNHV